MTRHQSDYGYEIRTPGPSKPEVQIAHEKSEWAYAVYIMTPGGYAYSQRFEYDDDIRGSRVAAKDAALADYGRQCGAHLDYNSYNDL